jgi:hypothetical protein
MDRFVAPRAADNVSSIHGGKSDLLALMMAGKSENRCNGISNQVKGWEKRIEFCYKLNDYQLQ